jgi:hypothetical protein
MNPFTLLIYIALALGIMLGIVKPRTFGRFLLGLLIWPIFIGVAFTLARQVFESLSPMQRIAVIILSIIPAVLILLRFILPRDIWAGVVSGFIHDALKATFMLPIKLVRSGFRLASRRAIR